MITFSFRPRRCPSCEDRRLREDARGFLERRRGDEALRRERRLRNPEQKRLIRRGLAAFGLHAQLLGLQQALVDLLALEKLVSPGSSILTLRSICRTIVSMCLSSIRTPWRR